MQNADSAGNLSALIDFSRTTQMKAFNPDAIQPGAKPALTAADFGNIKLNLDLPEHGSGDK